MARKRKTKTHVTKTIDESTPRSLIFKSGTVPKQVLLLIKDLKKVYLPNTAPKLKAKKSNKLKDFLMVVGQLHVSHLIIFTSSKSLNLRIVKVPKGPTLYFKVDEFSLMKDVLSSQSKPHPPSSLDYITPPLVILNNFKSDDKVIQLLSTTFQNMFPALKVSKMRPGEAKRVVLFHLLKQEGTNDEKSDTSDTHDKKYIVQVRHYLITLKTLGISKPIKKLQKLPDLSNCVDFEEFVKSGGVSDSDISDVEDFDSHINSNDDGAEKKAVRLKEIGPRMNLELVKVTSGVCGGSVLYHQYIQKTKEQVEQLESRKEEERVRREERRAEQERNVQKKKKSEGGVQGEGVDEVEEDKEEEYDTDDFEELMNDAYEGEDDEGDVSDGDEEME